MASRRKQERCLVRCFEVSDPTLHEKGHTIYKVTQKIINVEKPEDEVQEFVAWRRFNDFKKLYKAMHTLHTALHRKEEFPPFSQPKMFGRFETSVIEERMNSAQDLLNFVGQRHYLVANKAFQQFFQGAVKVEKSPNEMKVIQPQAEKDQLNSTSDPEDDRERRSELSNQLSPPTEDTSRSSSPELGGVWQYRQVADDISLGDDSESQTDTDFTDDSSVLGTPLPDSEASFFDPMKSEETDIGADIEKRAEPVSNEWLLSQMAVLETEVEAPDAAVGVGDGYLRVGMASSGQTMEVEMTGADQQVLNELLMDSSESSYPPEPPSGSPAHQWSHEDSPLSSNSLPKAEPHSSISNRLTSGLPKGPTPVSSPVRSIVSLDMRSGHGDYIILAANQISLAQQCEANGNYQMAFSYYKAGVGILLTGVQKDDDSTRREVVRRKTARYLMKAEELFHTHLGSDTVPVNSSVNCRWDTGQPSPAKQLDPNVAILQGALPELSNYKVLGVIGRVLLVMDSLTEGTYVIKVLQKTCTQQDMRRSIVPSHVPFTVRLYKFYETESAIFLLLQHAPGGRLWNYVSAYLNQHHELEINGVLDDPNERQLRKGVHQGGDNMYHGRSEIPVAGNVKPVINTDTASSITHEKPEISPDLSVHKTPTFPTRRQSSLGFDDIQESVHAYNGQSNFEESVSDSYKFEDILKSTQITSGNFSIESIDSDSDGGSRFHSTASVDHSVEVIPEVNEEQSTPDKGCQDDVFRRTNSAIEDNAAVIADTNVSDYDNLTADGADSADIDDLDLIAKQAIVTSSDCKPRSKPQTPSSLEELSPRKAKTAVSKSGHGNNSIYDTYPDSDNYTNSASSSKVGSPVHKPAYAPNSLHHLTDEHGMPRSHSYSKSLTQITRLPSQEHSITDESSKPRARTLSDVFGELDLAGGEGDGQSCMRQIARLPEGCVCQWAAEMVVAISSLHSLGIVCRDLHPDNILLGDRGHVMLTYFSWWNCVDWEPCQRAVDEFYVAPEVRGVYEVGPACDWWSLGTLLYELLTGKSLFSCHPSGITSHTHVSVPDDLSPEAQSLLQELLRPNPSERLGSGIGGVEDIRSHPFFSSINWVSLMGQHS